jgi:hypothetical protein
MVPIVCSLEIPVATMAMPISHQGMRLPLRK